MSILRVGAQGSWKEKGRRETLYRGCKEAEPDSRGAEEESQNYFDFGEQDYTVRSGGGGDF